MAESSQTQALLHKLRPRAERRAGLWITSREAFWIALETLRTHKLRSFLTLLGVVIATTTLIVVMSVINGMNLFIADRIANLGANVFIVHQYKWAQGYEAWLKARRRNQAIRIEDFEFLRDNLRGYKNIGAEAWINSSDNQARYKGRTVYEVRISGETPNMIDIGQTKVDVGRYLNDTDYDHESMVCFVGQDLVNDFFPSVDPIEKEIQINGIPFRIIGTAQKLGSIFGESQDNFVQVPLTTYQKVFRNRPSLAVSVQASNSLEMSVLEDEVRALLRARRHIPYN